MEDTVDRMEELGIRSSDVKSFLSNPVWRCIRGDLEERLELTRNDLENAPIDDVIIERGGKSTEVPGFRKLQGAAIELHYLLGLPDLMIDELKSKEEPTSEEEK